MKNFIKLILCDVSGTIKSYFSISFSICFLIFLIWFALYSSKPKNVNSGCKTDIKKIIFSFALLGCYFMIFFETIYSRPAHSRDSLALVFNFENIFADIKTGRYTFENILLFIPEGFLWSGIFQKKHRFIKIIFVSLLSSLAIEITQLATGRGYFQIDDLIMNTLGGFMGAIAYSIIAVTFEMFVKSDKN